MKKRNGFVSNSSSSSFVCDVCGRVESGFDASASDFDMLECENGHIFCVDEVVHSDIEIEDDYDVPAHFCPICSMQNFRDVDLVMAALIMLNTSRKELEDTLRGQFKTYDDFHKHIYGARK